MYNNIPVVYMYLATHHPNLSLSHNQPFPVSGGETSPLWSAAEYIKVFARMSPQGKAAVIRAIQKGTPSVSGGKQ